MECNLTTERCAVPGQRMIVLSTQHALLCWATVCKKVCPMLPDRCPVSPVLSLYVTLAHCGQTVGWINMKLGMENLG